MPIVEQIKDDELRYLRAELKEALALLHEMPTLVVCVKAAAAKGEDEMIEYAKMLVRWAPKAKAFLAKHAPST